jgi:L-ascorbate metabolism protein UlaG (beta-lactamase superfamily)
MSLSIHQEVPMRLTHRAVLVALLALLLGGCGHVISGTLTGGKPYDFLNHDPCTPSPEPHGDQIQLRYLGSGGIYLRWRDEAILLGPSFSNPGLIRARFLRVKPIESRINTGLNGIHHVKGILAGHSHYDHLGDVPDVARRFPDAKIWVNENGRNMLKGENLPNAILPLVAGEPIDVTSSIRVHPVVSGHAPQLCRWRRFPCVYAKGPITTPWTTPFPRHRLASMLGGETFALVIELHDETGDRYRIYYNDSSADAPLGYPTDGRTIDLAILTMAQWKWVDNYPAGLLDVLRPSHVVVSHWDNFFAEANPQTRFVPNLSNAGAAGFLTIVNKKVTGNAGPVNVVCGVPTARWTMPAPTTSMIFNIKAATP